MRIIEKRLEFSLSKRGEELVNELPDRAKVAALKRLWAREYAAIRASRKTGRSN